MTCAIPQKSGTANFISSMTCAIPQKSGTANNDSGLLKQHRRHFVGFATNPCQKNDQPFNKLATGIMVA
jgi:hypothetical protein